jgi:oligopeptidase B
LIGGLHDLRVSYWEPLKFAATLRHVTKPRADRRVCVKIDASAGHSFGSNRTKYFEEMAFIYSFLLEELGLATS